MNCPICNKEIHHCCIHNYEKYRILYNNDKYLFSYTGAYDTGTYVWDGKSINPVLYFKELVYLDEQRIEKLMLLK